MYNSFNLHPTHNLNTKKGHDNLLNIPLNNFGHKMVTIFRITLPTTYPKFLYDNMGDTGLEPVTPCLSSKEKKKVTIQRKYSENI